ncbi:MAG: ABC transporter permease [Halanaeroarchaeum sp.]
MSDSVAARSRRVRAEAVASYRTFVRRRTAVFFTFVFPVVLVVIFAGLVQTDPTGSGLFAKPTGYYVPGYLAVVVLFTPLSRVGSEVARYREDNRFEKLASTPLTRFEWLAAQSLVNVALILAAAVVLVVSLALLGTTIRLSPWIVAFVVIASILFCGIGAVIGRIASSQDGAISMSNGIALPLLFVSETFIAPEQFPAWFESVPLLSPLTYFSRGVRTAVYAPPESTPVLPALGVGGYLAILTVLAVLAFVARGTALSWAEE